MSEPTENERTALKRPAVGEYIEVYIRGEIKRCRVAEWRRSQCFFTNGYSLKWSATAGFLF